MAVEFPAFDVETSDPRMTLRKFVEATRDLLDELIEGKNTEELFRRDLIPRMRAAWKEARSLFPDLLDAILPVSPRRESLISESAIQQGGLDGAQLAFKLAVVRALYSRFQELGKAALRRLLAAIDTLLDSILSAIHNVVGHGIKEIKEYLEHSISD